MNSVYSKWFGSFLLWVGVFIIVNGMGFGQTGTIHITSSPFDSLYQLFSEDSSFAKNTTDAFFPYWSAPANHAYTLIWSNVSGYNTPSFSTAYLFVNSTITFNGIYTPSGSPPAI